MLQGAISKGRSALLLAGPPGCGKSALLERLGTMDSRFDIFTVHCGPSDRALRLVRARIRKESQGDPRDYERERAARCERRLRRRQTLGERAGARARRKQGDGRAEGILRLY